MEGVSILTDDTGANFLLFTEERITFVTSALFFLNQLSFTGLELVPGRLSYVSNVITLSNANTLLSGQELAGKQSSSLVEVATTAVELTPACDLLFCWVRATAKLTFCTKSNLCSSSRNV